MKKLSETYKDLGIAFKFPIEIKNKNGNKTYFEYSNGIWCRREYDENGNQTYYENSEGLKRGTKKGPCDGKVIEVDGKKYKLQELPYSYTDASWVNYPV